MDQEKCAHHRRLVAALQKPTQSVNIAEKVMAMARCQELCGILKQECLESAWPKRKVNGVRSDDEPGSDRGND